MKVPTRERLKFDYFDVTSNPLASARCAIPHSVHAALEALGFELVGMTLAKLRFNRAELLNEIWRDGDDCCSAMLTSQTGRAELVTLFEDGTIVKTIERPATMEWIHMRATTISHPSERFLYEIVPGPLDRVLMRHRERVAAITKSGRIVPAGSLQAHFATRIRAAELRNARVLLHLVSATLTAMTIAIVAAVLIVRFRLGPRAPGEPRTAGRVLLAEVSALMVFIPAQYLASWFVVPEVLRFRAGPKPRPATELMEIASRVPRGRVWRAPG